MSDGSKRHCWECLRRCLVCDSTKPACSRCTAAGGLCPGYGDVKPTRLRWVAPGKVNSRVRRRGGSCSAEPSKPGFHGQSFTADTSATVSRPNAKNISIPRFNMDTDTNALVNAAEYCKSFPIQLMQTSSLTGPDSQRLYLPRSPPHPGAWKQPLHISDTTRPNQGGDCTSRLPTVRWDLHAAQSPNEPYPWRPIRGPQGLG